MDVRKKLDEIKYLWGIDTDLELADKLGTAKHNIDSWVKREKIPEKWDWKIGQMSKADKQNLPVTKSAHPEDDENTVALNYYPDIVAAAGYGGINEYEFRKQTMKFDRRFLEQFLNIRRFDCLDIITVFGNSMEPFISNGETVIVERIDDARNGETVIANINGDIYIKRIKKDPLNRWVKFLSDNNEYDEIELKGKDLEHVTIIGIVRAKIRPF